MLTLEYLGHRILLTGDLEGIGLHDVLAEEPWHCDVLLAPHHGSRQSDPQRLAAWSTPNWLVVSGGHRIDLGPTRLAYQAVGSRIMHTGEDGAVRVTIDRAAFCASMGSCRGDTPAIKSLFQEWGLAPSRHTNLREKWPREVPVPIFATGCKAPNRSRLTRIIHGAGVLVARSCPIVTRSVSEVKWLGGPRLRFGLLWDRE